MFNIVKNKYNSSLYNFGLFNPVKNSYNLVNYKSVKNKYNPSLFNSVRYNHGYYLLNECDECDPSLFNFVKKYNPVKKYNCKKYDGSYLLMECKFSSNLVVVV